MIMQIKMAGLVTQYFPSPWNIYSTFFPYLPVDVQSPSGLEGYKCWRVFSYGVVNGDTDFSRFQDFLVCHAFQACSQVEVGTM